MKLADESRKMFEMFFRQYFSDEQFRLPQTYFYAGGFSRLITKTLKIHGITIGKNIFIKPSLLSIDTEFAKINTELAAHEIAHVLQYRREGFIKFLYKYLRSYRRNLKDKQNWNDFSRHEAYLEIPYEIEAREIAAQFVDWKKEFDRSKENRKPFDLY